jgi:LysM repeat protein
VDEGLIKEEEMESHPRRNEILRALGIRSDVETDVCTSPVRPANTDTLLLCTDGLNSMIPDTTIEAVMNENISVQHKAMKLVHLANEAGGYDNTTIQLINFYNVSNKKSDFIPAAAATAAGSGGIQPQKTSKMRRYIVYGIIGLCILAILYFIWDMFIKSSSPVPLIPAQLKDTVMQEQTDTASPKSLADNPAKPTNKDTVWISYIVQKGDVLGRISTKFSIPLPVIKKKNKLVNFNIDVGKSLLIPVKAEYQVKAGDNLDAIAGRYNTDKAKIKTANGFRNDSDLKVGKSIYIPF